MQRRKRKEFSSQAEYAKHRDAYAAFLIGSRVRAGEVRIVEKRVEVPVDRIVEKIVFRDPPEQSTLRKVGEGLEDVQAKLEARVRPDAVPYNFKIDLLKEEISEGEDLATVDQRLITEFGELEIRRPLTAIKEARRKRLYHNLYKFRG